MAKIPGEVGNFGKGGVQLDNDLAKEARLNAAPTEVVRGGEEEGPKETPLAEALRQKAEAQAIRERQAKEAAKQKEDQAQAARIREQHGVAEAAALDKFLQGPLNIERLKMYFQGTRKIELTPAEQKFYDLLKEESLRRDEVARNNHTSVMYTDKSTPEGRRYHAVTEIFYSQKAITPPAAELQRGGLRGLWQKIKKNLPGQ